MRFSLRNRRGCRKGEAGGESLQGNDRMKEMIQENYNRIKADVRQIVADELERIKSDPALAHLLQQT